MIGSYARRSSGKGSEKGNQEAAGEEGAEVRAKIE